MKLITYLKNAFCSIVHFAGKIFLLCFPNSIATMQCLHNWCYLIIKKGLFKHLPRVFLTLMHCSVPRYCLNNKNRESFYAHISDGALAVSGRNIRKFAAIHSVSAKIIPACCFSWNMYVSGRLFAQNSDHEPWAHLTSVRKAKLTYLLYKEKQNVDLSSAETKHWFN